MKTEFPEAKLAALISEDQINPRIFVIHEDAASSMRAEQCLNRLADNLNVEANAFSLHWTSFELLTDPALRRAAARKAGDYEIIFLSLRTHSELPAMLKEWMSEWLKNRDDRPCALAALFDEREQKPASDSPLLKYLTEVAEVGGLELVCPSIKTAKPLPLYAVRQIADNAINASPILSSILDDWEAYPHWGINE